jgi:hypothetical protein
MGEQFHCGGIAVGMVHDTADAVSEEKFIGDAMQVSVKYGLSGDKNIHLISLWIRKRTCFFSQISNQCQSI